MTAGRQAKPNSVADIEKRERSRELARGYYIVAESISAWFYNNMLMVPALGLAGALSFLLKPTSCVPEVFITSVRVTILGAAALWLSYCIGRWRSERARLRALGARVNVHLC